MDEEWGPILDRYQRLRSQQDVQKAEREKGLPVTERELVQQIVLKLQHSVVVNPNSLVNNSIINTGTLTLYYRVYQSSTGPQALDQLSFERTLRDYLDWVQKAYSKARLYGLESSRTSGGPAIRQLLDVFVPLSLRRFRP